MASVSSTRAATKFTATIEGGPELMKQLLELDAKMRTVVAKESVSAGLELFRERAQENAPVLDGHLRDSITVKVGKWKDGAQGTVAVRLVKGLPDEEQPIHYAARTEYGDSHEAAQPFMRPAFDTRKGAAADAVESGVRFALDLLR